MDVVRIRQEIIDAKRQFEYIESHLDPQGNPFVLVALQTTLQTTANHYYTLSIVFPDTYPNAMPSVYVRKPTINKSVVHIYENGNICFQHVSTWNPGRHDLKHVIARAAKWLNKYEVWLQTNRWPGKEIIH